MGKTIETTGKSLDDAIRVALNELMVDRDAVTVEVLEKGKTGFLGIGGTPARIRVTLLSDEPEDFSAPQPAPVSKPAPAPSRAQAAPKPMPVPEKPKDKPREKPPEKQQSAPPEPKSPSQAQSPKPYESRRRRHEFHPATPEQSENAARVLTEIVRLMGVEDGEVSARQEERFLLLEVTGSGLGRLIGRRGDTLDAVQRLCSCIVNKGQEKHVRLVVDTEQYRQKREDVLMRLAQKTAEKAVRYGNNMVLEPMNSYARHIIHTTLQNNSDVTTHSIGNEPNRRVVIAVPGGNDSRNRRKSGDRYGGQTK